MIATEERAALRVFLRALRALPPEPRWHATVWYPRPDRAAGDADPAAARADHVRGGLRVRRGRAAADRRHRGVRLRGRPRDAGDARARAGRRARCRWPRACPPTRRRWATASAASCSSPGRRRRWPRTCSGWSPSPSCASAPRRESRAAAPVAGLGARGRASSRPSTSSSPPAAATRLGNGTAARAAGVAAADRRRPAHAHRPLLRLRDAGRGAARRGASTRAGRDRRHRPQRDLRCARGPRQGQRASR